ncbi:MAG: hypothetical protein ACC700_13965 [Anaerolineales bacterium]
MNLEALELQIAQALQQAGRKLMPLACQVIEADLLEQQEPRPRQSKIRPSIYWRATY